MTDLITVTSLRQLDHLVAVKVLDTNVFCSNGEYYEDIPGNRLTPEYSSDNGANLRMKLHCLSKNIKLQIREIEYIGETQVKMDDPSEDEVAKATVYCLAALRGVGVEVDLKLGSDDRI